VCVSTSKSWLATAILKNKGTFNFLKSKTYHGFYAVGNNRGPKPAGDGIIIPSSSIMDKPALFPISQAAASSGSKGVGFFKVILIFKGLFKKINLYQIAKL
jgi:hypothetical protein